MGSARPIRHSLGAATPQHWLALTTAVLHVPPLLIPDIDDSAARSCSMQPGCTHCSASVSWGTKLAKCILAGDMAVTG